MKCQNPLRNTQNEISGPPLAYSKVNFRYTPGIFNIKLYAPFGIPNTLGNIQNEFKHNTEYCVIVTILVAEGSFINIF